MKEIGSAIGCCCVGLKMVRHLDWLGSAANPGGQLPDALTKGDRTEGF